MSDKPNQFIENVQSLFSLDKIKKDRIEDAINSIKTGLSGTNKDKIEVQFTLAQNKANSGEFDSAWGILHDIDSLLVEDMTKEEIQAKTKSLFEESEKFDEKRKKAVKELLKTESKENLKEAYKKRSEYYNTHYHKIRIRDKNLSIVLALLIIAIISIFIISAKFENADYMNRLFKCAAMGLLGATLSMAYTLTGKPIEEKIPDLIIGIRITFLRPAIGIAAAIVSLFLIDAKVLSAILSSDLVKKENLSVIAFIAGFSERWIISVVDILGKKG
jgi:predicted transcriptional regulator YdeE